MKPVKRLGSAAAILGVAAAAILTGAAAPAVAPQDLDVALDAIAVGNLGIQTVKIQPAQYLQATDGFGQVIPVDAWAQADADLATYEAATQSSKMALDRAQGLFQADISISRQALETAQRQHTADAAQLALAERKSAVVFGLRPPWQSSAERSAVLQRLTSGNQSLVRVTLPPGYVGKAPAQMTLRRPLRGESPEWTTKAIWDAPADPTIPGRSFFALVSGSNLAPGERVVASVPQGMPVSGVVVPADAVVLSEGQAWCYVAVKPETFARRAVDLNRPKPGGYFVTQGVKMGDAVVISGSALLLARQMNPSTEPEDE
jgi:hypothetical protein